MKTKSLFLALSLVSSAAFAGPGFGFSVLGGFSDRLNKEMGGFNAAMAGLELGYDFSELGGVPLEVTVMATLRPAGTLLIQQTIEEPPFVVNSQIFHYKDQSYLLGANYYLNSNFAIGALVGYLNQQYEDTTDGRGITDEPSVTFGGRFVFRAQLTDHFAVGNQTHIMRVGNFFQGWHIVNLLFVNLTL